MQMFDIFLIQLGPKSQVGEDVWAHFVRPYSAGNVFEGSFAHFGSLLAHFWSILVIVRSMLDHFCFLIKQSSQI